MGILLRVISMVALSFALGAQVARAQPALSPAALTVHAGATCVSAESLHAQVESWLGGVKVEPEMRVEVTGSDENAREIGFVLHQGARVVAERRFAPGPSACMQLEATLALAIALALKVSLLQELMLAAPERLPALALGASALALLGFAPHAPLGAQATVDVALAERVWLRTGLAFWSAGNNQLSRVNARFDMRGLAARLDGCAAPLRTLAWSLTSCLGARLGGIWAHGERLASSVRARKPWGALAASLGVLLPLSARWSLSFDAALLISLVRPRFQVTDVRGQAVDAHTIPTFASELSIGPRLQF